MLKQRNKVSSDENLKGMKELRRFIRKAMRVE